MRYGPWWFAQARTGGGRLPCWYAGPQFWPSSFYPSWRHLLTSAVLNGVYFILIADAYARGSMALDYPLMRGTAPMLTACRLCPDGRSAATARAGIAAICTGVAALARPRGVPGERTTVRLALTNAVVIAAYTLNDALGARISGVPLAYTL
jgi:hypothetical protein